MSHPNSPPPAALRDKLGELLARFPAAPYWATRLSAFVLTSPATSSDAALLVADALDEYAGTNPGEPPPNAHMLDVLRLAGVLREAAPDFARAVAP